MHHTTGFLDEMEGVECTNPGQLSLPIIARTISEFPLLNLPAELVLCVFDVLVKEGDWCTLTCLGLSCRILYHTLKQRYYPNPISLVHNLWSPVGGGPFIYSPPTTMFQPQRVNNGYVPLAHLIKNFIGPDYRLLNGEVPPFFVSKKVYGDQDDCDNKKERELRGRRRDFKRMTHYRGGKATHLLPSPFNKGEGWTEEVWEIWLEFEKLGWTKDTKEYFRRNIKTCNVNKTLSRRMECNGTRRWTSEDVPKGDGTF